MVNPHQPLYLRIQHKLDYSQNEIAPVKSWEGEEIPKLLRQPDSVLTKYWWSEGPFPRNTELWLPVYSLQTQEFTNEVVQLESLIFNQPIRRDIVHNVNHYSLMFNNIKTHRTKNQAEIYGSGKKPRAQKGSGRARQGNLRAGGRIKGTKNWGPRPRDYTYYLPEKIKVKGILACLSAKLGEGKIRILDSDELEDHKTNKLYKMLPKFGEKELFLFVYSKKTTENFRLAVKNIRKCKEINPNMLNVQDLLKFDKIIFTKESLKETIEFLLCVLYMHNKPKVIRNNYVETVLNLNYSREQPDAEEVVFNPEEGFEPKFEILRDYYAKYNEMREAGELEQYNSPNK